MKLIIAGGGTGGHLFPGVAVSRILLRKSPQSRVLFIGSLKELDSDLMAQEKFNFASLGQRPFPPSFFSLKGAQFVLSSVMSLLKALPLVWRYNPDVVLGMGGFSSVPTVLAAWLLRIPSVCFEPNLYPGRANRFIAPFVSKVALGFKLDKTFFPPKKMVLTGIPVREGIGERVKASDIGESFTLVVMGGSRGAKALNQMIVSAYPELKKKIPNLKLIHLTGKDSFNEIKGAYPEGDFVEVAPFVREMDRVLNQAHLVVARSGASSLAEFARCGLPSILVPYPYSTHDHQQHNADFFKERGAAVVIREKELTPEKFLNQVLELVSNPDQLRLMQKASEKLAVKEATENLFKLLKLVSQKNENTK